MTLDTETLLVVNIANLAVLATLLPLIMGEQLSEAASAARKALILQAFSWVALLVSGAWPGTWVDWALSVFAMGCISAANWLMHAALSAWLGVRPWRRTLAVLCILMPLGYMFLFPSYPVRVGWSNLLIAMQILVLARATLFPSTHLRGPWRWVMMASFACMAILTAARGIMGAWFTTLYPNFTAPHPVNVAALFAANITLVLINVAVLVAWRAEAEQLLRTLAVTDQLTGVRNRHGWTEPANSLVTLASRYKTPVALISMDLDHFKRINDAHGHDAGDTALRLFGRLLTESKRSGDVVARIGGEEFCVLMPHTDEVSGSVFDRRLRNALALAAPHELGYPLNFSSGLAVLNPEGETLTSLMARADAAMYRAKGMGRGTMVVAEALSSSQPTFSPSDCTV